MATDDHATDDHATDDLRVVVTCVYLLDVQRVRVTFRYVHPRVLDMVRLTPLCGARETAERDALKRTRSLLQTLDVLEVVQRCHEAQRARDTRAMGFARSRSAVIDAIMFHDACTLYLGCLGMMMGRDGSWYRLQQACDCGANEWGYTCTPPCVRGGRLRRETLAACVSFCWTCARRRDQPPPHDFFTHSAPQYSE
jgi:hypothetical protein